MTSSIDSFFAFAKERHSIYNRRKAGLPRPWTEDPILDTYRFTNVYRELDATTVWFKTNVREPMRNDPDVLLATVLFRWFNRITTGEAIFKQQYHGTETPWELLLRRGKEGGGLVDLKHAIRAYCGKGPYVTGAYIIKTPDGYDKLDGVVQCIEWFMADQDQNRLWWKTMAKNLAYQIGTLEATWLWLREFQYLGDFMAYEIVTDLMHTDLLCKAPDIMTWANPGPGATRGLGRVLHDNPKKFNQHRDKAELIKQMELLLRYSRRMYGWTTDEFPRWTMREVEHTLCEFDKYERVRLGEGKPRGRYR